MSKAISNQYKCNPCKRGLDGIEYVQVDIDRLITFLKTHSQAISTNISSGYFKGVEEYMEAQIDAYEGLLGEIEANSFK